MGKKPRKSIKRIENFKKKPKLILELKSTLTEMKNSQEGCRGRLNKQKEDSVHFKIGQWKFSKSEE